MDEISVFRRFFVASTMIRDLISGVSGSNTGNSEIPPHLGSNRGNAIQGIPNPRNSRRRTPRRQQQAPPPEANVEKFNFPS